MFILLIILISLLILALRLILIGSEVAGRVVRRNLKGKGKGKSVLRSGASAVTRTGIGVGRSSLRIVIFALQWLRGLLIGAAISVLALDIFGLAIITAGAAGAYVLFMADETEGVYSSVNRSNKGSSSSSSAAANINNLDWNSIGAEDARALLKDISSRWDSKVTDERAKLILLGATRIGKSTYSWSNGRGGDSDDQSVFDCSSFVGWCFYKTGHEAVLPDSTTASFIDGSTTAQEFERISASDLVPGDIALLHDTLELYNANHVGIYVGKSAEGKMMFMHCTSREQDSPHKVSNGVRISEYSWEVFLRYKKWK